MTTGGYFPLFRKIFDSSINDEELPTRWVWLAMLSKANRDGMLTATPTAISRLANVPLEVTQSALKVLMSPDAHSGSEEEEGRRIIEVSPNLWRLVNYEFYQEMAKRDRAREMTAERTRKYRERQGRDGVVMDGDGVTVPVTGGDGSDGNVTVSPSGSVSVLVSGKEEEESEEEKRDFPKFIMDEWNGRGCVPRVRTMTDTRRSSVSARARQHGGEDAVFTAVLKRSQSDFLSNVIFDGKGAPFDWVMGPKNFPKVLEGNYDDDRGPGADPVPPSDDWLYETVRRSDRDTYGNHSMWDEYADEAAEHPPQTAPKFEEWLQGQMGD